MQHVDMEGLSDNCLSQEKSTLLGIKVGASVPKAAQTCCSKRSN